MNVKALKSGTLAAVRLDRMDEIEVCRRARLRKARYRYSAVI
jgi:hypothetical protein